MKLGRVITTARGAEVCQRCLIKWARKIIKGRFLCNSCHKVESV